MHKAVLEKETHAKWEPYSCVSSPTEFELALDFFFFTCGLQAFTSAPSAIVRRLAWESPSLPFVLSSF